MVFAFDPTHPFAPRLLYWKNEQSGKLCQAVEAYFQLHPEATLSPEHIASLKSYILHWLRFPGFQFEDEADRQKLIQQCEQVSDRQGLNELLGEAVKFNIDPF